MINLGDLALYAFLTLLIVERGLGHMSYVYVLTYRQILLEKFTDRYMRAKSD